MRKCKEYPYPYKSTQYVIQGGGKKTPVGFASTLSEAKKKAKRYAKETGESAVISKDLLFIKGCR